MSGPQLPREPAQGCQEASRRSAEHLATETEQRMAADVRLETCYGTSLAVAKTATL
jgi:hypothetical protein